MSNNNNKVNIVFIFNIIIIKMFFILILSSEQNEESINYTIVCVLYFWCEYNFFSMINFDRGFWLQFGYSRYI